MAEDNRTVAACIDRGNYIGVAQLLEQTFGRLTDRNFQMLAIALINGAAMMATAGERGCERIAKAIEGGRGRRRPETAVG